MKEVSKSILILLGVFRSMIVFAIEPSNYHISSQILSIPNLVVKDKGLYKDTKLLLNLEGSWKILDLDPNPTLETQLNLTGHWGGQIDRFPGDICFNPHPEDWWDLGYFDISLIQNKNVLTGAIIGNAPCAMGVDGKLIGTINDRTISFTMVFSNGDEIKFKGKIFNDFGSIEGIATYNKPIYGDDNWDWLSLSPHSEQLHIRAD